jgi:hypothetical protein
MDYVPVAVGSAVGLADGIIGQVGALNKYSYAHTVFRAAVFGVGLAGEFLDWPADINYALMTASTAMIASRLPAAFAGGPKSLGEVIQMGTAVLPVAAAAFV